MARIGIIISCFILSCVFAFPANNDQLDKATVNDVAVNTVMGEKPTSASNEDQKKGGASIQITGISTGLDSTQSSQPPFTPQKAGTMFARFIDDIFQIPIAVLQSVAKLITNPFTTAKKNPEAAVST